ncbi:MAG: choice-of-anchor L domain-containing protein [Saprospiraceae bacterium]|nr:choice-of-anchor L domain-containing protein [Saprospiraceae bacterium]
MKKIIFAISRFYAATLVIRLVCFLIMILPRTSPAQFQKIYGSGGSDVFYKVIPDGNAFYVLGSVDTKATVSRISGNGTLLWTHALTISSIWADGVIEPGTGNLILVGFTYLTDQSIIGELTQSGVEICVQLLDEPGPEALYRIERNPGVNTFSAMGFHTNPSTLRDVVVYNISPGCVINSKKQFFSLADDYFAEDMEVMSVSGDIVVTGVSGNNAVIYQVTGSGAFVNGVQGPGQYIYRDLAETGNGDLLAIANQNGGAGAPHAMRFDNNLLPLWEISINELFSLDQVVEGGNGIIYLMGRTNIGGTIRPVVVKINDSNGPPTAPIWAKYLVNMGNYSSFLALTPAGIAAADGLPPQTNGFGLLDAVLVVTDLELESDCTLNTTVTLTGEQSLFDGAPAIELFDSEMPQQSSAGSTTLNLGEASVCGTVPCEVTISITPINNCGLVQVTATATGPGPITFQWCNGETNSSYQEELSCGEHTICVFATCMDGSMATASINYVVSDPIPPTAICQNNVVIALDANCMATVSTSDINDNSFDNCQITSLSVSPTIFNQCDTFPVTLTVEDWCGNISTCISQVQVTDTIPPVITCPPNLTVNTNPGECFYTGVLPSPTATDNCNPNPVLSCYLVTETGAELLTPQTELSKGTNTICCIADDGCVAIDELVCTYPCSSELMALPPGVGQVLDDNSTLTEVLTVIDIQPGISGDELVRDIFIGGPCFDVSNVTTQGQASQFGVFSNGFSSTGIDSGVILATGPSILGIGPNNSDNAGIGLSGLTPDADLSTLTTGSLFDKASLEFDFIPTQTYIAFNFVFASEEYCERVGSPVSDVVGFFISGPGIPGGQQNIALLPLTSTPVNANTINHLAFNGWYRNNQPASSANLCGQNPSISSGINELQYDGLTLLFSAITNVQVGQSYHIKLAIADVGDDLFDSAVFLKMGSFDAGGNASVAWEVNSTPVSSDAVYEDCGTANLIFSRVGGNLGVPLTVPFTISGTALPGADYVPFPSSIVIPAGQYQFVLPITILNDAVFEADETLVITLNDACSFLQPNTTITIKDKALLQAKCTYTVTVEDHEPPMIICPPSLTVTGILDTNGMCTAVVGGLAPIITDNCPMTMTDYLISGATIDTGVDDASGTVFNPGASTVEYTVTDMGGNSAVCQTIVTVICDFGGSCDCPMGSFQGPDLIENGDFSAGNTGFTSDYNYLPVPAPGQGNYTVSTSFNWTNFPEWSALDHTTGSPTGKILVVDGSFTPGLAAWRENVNITPATDYQFCAYVNNLFFFATNHSDPNIEVWLVDANNNSTFLTSVVLPEAPDLWVKISASWTAPTTIANPYKLEIREAAGVNMQSGNDFAVDDITFRACSLPPPCYCGTFSDMFVRGPQGGYSQPVSCGGPPLNIGCPAPGFGYTLTGSFLCDGVDCPDEADLDWELLGPDGGLVENGTMKAGPWFILQMASADFVQAGVYTLVMSGHCGTEACPCNIQFIVDPECPEPCPCEYEDWLQMQEDVRESFASTVWANSCTACFSPLGLSDCYEVEWYLDNPNNGQFLGSSMSNQTFCYTFPGPGTYEVVMSVFREKPDGSFCGAFYISEIITITCQIPPDCGSPLIPNPRFSEGATAGPLNDFGASEGWNGIAGDPVVVEGEPGSLDGWTIQLTGNYDDSDILSLFEPVCLEKDSGTISIHLRLFPWGDPHINEKDGKKWDFKVKFYQGDAFEINNCDSMNCLQLASIDLTLFDTSWALLEFPYDLRDWNPPVLCEGLFVRPAIYVTNLFGEEQGADTTRARLQIDNFCINGQLVGVGDPIKMERGFSLFPNPTTGELVLRFDGEAPKSAQLQILDLWGRTLQTEIVQPSLVEHIFSLEGLPSGAYFVKMIDDRKMVWVEKVIKQ